MIEEFVNKWEAGKDVLRAQYATKAPDSYEQIVEDVIKLISPEPNDYDKPSYNRIHKIDDGDYQGTLLFVIGAGGYQPNDYWSVFVGYGSCSGCDTLQSIMSYSDDPPDEEQLNDFMGLALNVVQGLKKVGEPS